MIGPARASRATTLTRNFAEPRTALRSTATNLFWVFTTGGGQSNTVSNVVLTVNGTDYPVYDSPGNLFRFVTPYIAPEDIDSAYVTYDGNTGNGDVNLTISHGCTGIVEAAALGIGKTAAGTYDNTYGWTIVKTSDTETVYSVGGGESGAVNYTVTVSHDDGTISNVAVSGTITVYNPNGGAVTIDGISDTLSNSTSCDVTGDEGASIPGGTVAVPGSSDFSYTCNVGGNSVPSGLTNTATASWSDQTLSDDSELAAGSTPTDPVDVSFTGNDIDTCVDVSDSVEGALGTVCVGDDNPTEFEYSNTFTDPAGTCTSHKNTATFLAPSGATDSDSVTVQDCQGADLTVEKTANPSYERTFTWDITKSVDKTYVEQTSGTVTFNYTVSVSHDAGTDSDIQVTGKITVSNPNDWQTVTVDVTDSVDNGGTCSVTGGTDVEVPASDSVELDYTCTYASVPSDGVNTATATWDAAAAHTPNGSDTGTANVDFGDPTTVTDECVDVTDTYKGDLGQVCVGDANPTEFKYSRTVNVPAPRQCQTFDNTATFTTTDTETSDSDSETVKVCNFAAPLTPGYWKTHLAKTGSTGCTGLPQGTGCSNNGPFASTYLPLSLGNYTVNTIQDAAKVFAAMNCGSSTSQNAMGCLAGHLLASKLNAANGANTCIDATIAKAQAFLSGQTVDGVPGINYTGPTGNYSGITTAQRDLAISLKNALDKFNNGLGCP